MPSCEPISIAGSPERAGSLSFGRTADPAPQYPLDLSWSRLLRLFVIVSLTPALSSAYQRIDTTFV